MRTLSYLSIFFFVFIVSCSTQTKPPSTPITQTAREVSVVKDTAGWKLWVNDQPFFVEGMNWDYYPVGTNYDYSLWNQSDVFIKKALDDEMSLLQQMGVNAIRQYTGVPAKWISYIYENYGIYTMLNHSFGRYGMTLDGEWIPTTDYSDPRVLDILIPEVAQLVETYQGTPGLLFFLLGNENNYGLFWEGAETEDIPEITEADKIKARALYQAFNSAAIRMKEISDDYPIALCNGDVQFIDLIAEECTAVDIFGMNIYRGASFGDAYTVVKQKLDKPVVLTEFGADAYDALKEEENQTAQANYLIENWKEIYQHAAGQGLANNSIGGFTFQFSDGWWKYGQTKYLDVHDTYASWGNGGYDFDFEEGINNMNEEWFGVCAKGPTQQDGSYLLSPRLAYYALQQAHEMSPYDSNTNAEAIDEFFSKLNVASIAQKLKQ